MPQVPYNPVPTVGAQDSGVRLPSVDTPIAAFGGATAQAVSGLGKVLEGAGNELFARALALQELNNQAEAKEADSEYMVAAGKLHAEYNSLQGKAAVDGYEPYVQNLKDLRQSMRGRLGNDASKRMFDSASLNTMGRTIFNGASHAASQNRAYVVGASTARVEAIKDQTLTNPGDELTFRRGVAAAEAEVRNTQAPLAGWSPEKTEVVVKKTKSDILATRIASLARTQPFSAKQLLEDNREEMFFDDFERTDKVVQDKLRSVGARNISDEIEAPKGQKPLQELLDAAAEKAKSVAPEDTIFHDYVRERVIADFNRSKAVKRDQDLANRNVIEGGLVGGTDGKIPTSLEELTANATVERAWEALDARTQRSYLKVLAQNAKGDQAWTQDVLKEYQGLKGMAQTDPVQFLDTDVTGMKLPMSAKRELVNMQIKLKAKPEGDPRVQRAIGILRPTLVAAGIEPTRNKEQYYQFVGALQDAVSDFTAENKKTPTAKDIQAMGSRLLQEQSTPWMLNPWSKTPVFEVPVPAPDKEIIKNDPAWSKLGITPSDEQVQRVYTRRLYQKLYGGAKPSAEPEVPRSR